MSYSKKIAYCISKIPILRNEMKQTGPKRKVLYYIILDLYSGQIMREGVCDGRSVEDEATDDERGEGEGGGDGERDAAGEDAELELDGVDHGEQQEEGAHGGAPGGEQHHGLREPEHGAAPLPRPGGAPCRHLLAVVGRRGLLVGVAVEVVGGQERDGELHPLRHEAGQQVEAEGEDLEEEEVARDVVPRDAGGRHGRGRRDGARDPDEHRHREEGVGRHDSLQRLHVQFRVAPPQRRHRCRRCLRVVSFPGCALRVCGDGE
jgi:hypothetical protein|uniref:Uncharacterized protein n=1 Tax=Zea mays TaxID=4577 RepID=A0A804MIY9_MAIZE